MQTQIYELLARRSGRPLKQIIRDTKRTDLYLDAVHAREYGLIDEVVGSVKLQGGKDNLYWISYQDRDPARAFLAGEGTVGPAERISVRLGQRVSDDSANVIFAENGAIETVGH